MLTRDSRYYTFARAVVGEGVELATVGRASVAVTATEDTTVSGPCVCGRDGDRGHNKLRSCVCGRDGDRGHNKQRACVCGRDGDRGHNNHS